MKKISIALDGPAGSGKSTVAKLVAQKFDYIYIDTGAMYRAITLKALQQNVDLSNERQLVDLAEQSDIQLQYLWEDGQSILHTILDGLDVSEAIRSIEVTNNVSVVASVAGVRDAMVRLQQAMAQSGGVVMDGRDIGTVVLPNAELKIFLTASVEERGKRRWLELKQKGIDVDLAELIEQIKKRDFIDSNREVNPLRQAEDALLLDTTEMTLEAVVERIVNLAKEKGAVLK
ncbi:MAG TPA: (d)CMP kinase [Bacillota bacterium]|nr:(d)CMP kinase [Bacillota bacterium]HOL10318.1 (d)CMP kinase [Bacillota bacterium]HPO98092.1 (d)CMP kinase [Bacillota bacterium]